MSVETKPVQSCPACGSPEAKSVLRRAGGIAMARCQRCRSTYLERIPVSVAELYAHGCSGLSILGDSASESLSGILPLAHEHGPE